MSVVIRKARAGSRMKMRIGEDASTTGIASSQNRPDYGNARNGQEWPRPAISGRGSLRRVWQEATAPESFGTQIFAGLLST